jgi:hypothetical protein
MIGILKTERGRWKKFYHYFTIISIFELSLNYNDFLIHFALSS